MNLAEWVRHLKVRRLGNDYWYSCQLLTQEDGVAACSEYDCRPQLCRNFPHGKPVTWIESCAWNVEVKEAGRT